MARKCGRKHSYSSSDHEIKGYKIVRYSDSDHYSGGRKDKKKCKGKKCCRKPFKYPKRSNPSQTITLYKKCCVSRSSSASCSKSCLSSDSCACYSSSSFCGSKSCDSSSSCGSCCCRYSSSSASCSKSCLSSDSCACYSSSSFCGSKSCDSSSSCGKCCRYSKSSKSSKSSKKCSNVKTCHKVQPSGSSSSYGQRRVYKRYTRVSRRPVNRRPKKRLLRLF